MSARRILMCAPTYFDVVYAINPWMKVGSVDKRLAYRQWEATREAVRATGAKVFTLEPDKSCADLPDMVFSANAAVVRGKHVYMAHMFNKERRGEREPFTKWFEANGYTVHGHYDVDKPFEGAAEADLCGGFDTSRLYGSTGQRTSPLALKLLANAFSHITDENNNPLPPIKSVTLNLVTPDYYHLDCCFCPIDAETIVAHLDAFDEPSKKVLKEHFEIIEVPAAEARAFACNLVVVDKHIVMPAHTDATAARLQARGFDVQQVDVSEFLKSGGAVKCMTLRV